MFLVHFAGGSKARPTFIDDRIRAAVGSSAVVVGYTAPVPPGGATTGGAYRTIGATAKDGGTFPDLAGVLAWAAAHGAGTFKPGPVVVGGFSEGVQGARAWIGQPIAGLLAVDGAHASDPPDVASQLAPWQGIAARARAGELPVTFTYSQIDPVGYLSVRETLRRAIDVEPMPPGRGVELGALRVASYPGNDGAAHARQLQEVLPLELQALAERLGFGGDRAALLALLGVRGESCSINPRASGDGQPARACVPTLPADGIGAGPLVALVVVLVCGSLAVKAAPAGVLPWSR